MRRLTKRLWLHIRIRRMGGFNPFFSPSLEMHYYMGQALDAAREAFWVSMSKGSGRG